MTARLSLTSVAKDAKTCQRCPLYRFATQTVFGEGPAHAPVMMVGEVPGDQEDLQGRPFVGPAGRILDRALADAGVKRDRVYVTNAVKHFKFEPRGKRRLHKKPNAGEIEACKWWLNLELDIIKPALAVALGATAARALAGRTIPIGTSRGHLIQFQNGLPGLVTIHPSFLLRMPDPEIKAQEYSRFVEDLRLIAQHVPAAKRAA
ncbi:UdgX family uracil-DNA binding protein [Dongia deserti]|uniref:UdgX family uracil-DNA binding protein n=1 Tax=Dongia deserti TaxID=2268030 RepID=UPI000E657DEC|nr:UdgX family uracil-DNA binding protein [Dongia deserti]